MKTNSKSLIAPLRAFLSTAMEPEHGVVTKIIYDARKNVGLVGPEPNGILFIELFVCMYPFYPRAEHHINVVSSGYYLLIAD